jgi:hypothetical protein
MSLISGVHCILNWVINFFLLLFNHYLCNSPKMQQLLFSYIKHLTYYLQILLYQNVHWFHCLLNTTVVSQIHKWKFKLNKHFNLLFLTIFTWDIVIQNIFLFNYKLYIYFNIKFTSLPPPSNTFSDFKEL